MPHRNLVDVLGREVRQGSPGELMVESSPSRQGQPSCKTNKEKSDEAADAAALTYLLTYLYCGGRVATATAAAEYCWSCSPSAVTPPPPGGIHRASARNPTPDSAI